MVKKKLSCAVGIISRCERNDYLIKAVKSILSQTHKPDILFISVPIDKKDSIPIYIKNIKTVNIITQQQTGLVSAMQTIVKNNSCDILAFIDDDAKADKFWLENIIKLFSSNKNVGVIGGSVFPYISKGKLNVVSNPVIGKVNKDSTVIKNYDYFLKDYCVVDCVQGTNMAFRKKVLDKICGFDLIFDKCGYRFETDACLSAKDVGFLVCYFSKAKVFHKGGLEGGAGNGLNRMFSFNSAKNSVILSFKHNKLSKYETANYYLLRHLKPDKFSVRCFLYDCAGVFSGIITSLYHLKNEKGTVK